jgi:tripeptide aminopeptidase
MDEIPRVRRSTVTEPHGAHLAELQRLEADPRVQHALGLLRQRAAPITELQIEFARLPSPDARAPLRAAFLRRALESAGVHALRVDAAGNVIGFVPRADGSPGEDRRVVVLSAHLDTVFPELAHIEIERDGDVLRGAGIADDAAGLAAIVHLAGVLGASGMPLRHDVAVVGTVGEEGEGDLRGVKHLFASELAPERVAAFITLDLGDPEEIVHGGIGSRRLRATVHGPGGHSWGDFGRPNPIHALVRGLDGFLTAVSTGRVRSSYNVGVIEGGRGVNVIPESASARIDLRSESAADLAGLESQLRACLDAGVAAERAWSRAGAEGLRLELEVIGDRPAGTTAADSDLVRTAVAAFGSRNLRVRLGASSTDANEPMRLGVPAVALPHGARAEETHSRREWCRVGARVTVLEAVLLALVRVAGGIAEPPRAVAPGGDGRPRRR